MRLVLLTIAAALASAPVYVSLPASAQTPPIRHISAPKLCSRSLVEINAVASRALKKGSPGMAVGVSHGGKTVLARGYGLANVEHQAPMDANNPFLLASVTKQFTAAAALLLVQDGRLSLEDRLSRFVPELPQAENVTIRQLLIQTSGIPDYAEDPDGSATKAVARDIPKMIDWIGRLKPAHQFAPGTAWRYSNSNYLLIGAVIERASGLSLADFFRERLFEPAGLTHTAWDDPRDVVPGRVQGYRRAPEAPSGFAHADWISPTLPGPAGGLRTTITDLLRWSDALYGGKIINEQSLKIMTAPGRLSDGRTTRFGMPKEWQEGLNSDYGMGVFITAIAGGRRIWHAGDTDGFSTWLAHYPERSLTIALMVNSQSVDIDEDAVERAVIDNIAERC